MIGRVEGKVCIVTGAGPGIGRATALRLAEEGGSVLVTDLVGEEAEKVAQQAREAGGDALARDVDVADSRQVDDMITDAVEHWGRVDVLVNNAGVNLPAVLHEVSEQAPACLAVIRASATNRAAPRAEFAPPLRNRAAAITGAEQGVETTASSAFRPFTPV